MFTLFALPGNGAPQTATVIEDVRGYLEDEQSVLWIDIERPTQEELDAIGALFQLDAEALEDCLLGEQRPRMDEYEHYLFLVMYGAMADDREHVYAPRKLAIFFGKRFIITVHRDALPSVTEVRQRCEKHAAYLLRRGADYLLYLIIDGIVDNLAVVVDHFEERLERLEEASLMADVSTSILGELAELKRDCLDLRRIAASQGEMVYPMARGELEEISEPLEARFSHVRDHLIKTVEMIDGVRDLLNGVRDNYHAMLANRLNAIMKTLTLFASVLLPLSLIAGIYGMNVALWPGPEVAWAYPAILTGMALFGAGMYTYFRFRRWL